MLFTQHMCNFVCVDYSWIIFAQTHSPPVRKNIFAYFPLQILIPPAESFSHYCTAGCLDREIISQADVLLVSCWCPASVLCNNRHSEAEFWNQSAATKHNWNNSHPEAEFWNQSAATKENWNKAMLRGRVGNKSAATKPNWNNSHPEGWVLEQVCSH